MIVRLDPVPNPVEAGYVALFGWLRAGVPPRAIEFRVFDRPIYHELHDRSDLAAAFPHEFVTGLYAIVDIAAVTPDIRRSGMALSYEVRIDGSAHVGGDVRVSERALDLAAAGAAHRQAKRDFVLAHAACPSCGAALAASGAASALRCHSCGAEFPQTAGALNFIGGDAPVPKILNTSVFQYSSDERDLIRRVEGSGGWVLDFGAGLRESIEPRVVNVEISDYPTTDVLSTSDRLPFVDGVFDGLISLHVLEHVKHPWLIVREFARVLKSGGTAICTVPFISPEHGFPDHYYNMTPSGLRNLFSHMQIEQHVMRGDAHPINGIQQLLSTYNANLEEPHRSRFRDLRIGDLIDAPLSALVAKDYAVALSDYGRWKLPTHTTIVIKKP